MGTIKQSTSGTRSSGHDIGPPKIPPQPLLHIRGGFAGPPPFIHPFEINLPRRHLRKKFVIKNKQNNKETDWAFKGILIMRRSLSIMALLM